MTKIAVLDDYQQRAHTLADWDRLGPGAEITYLHEPVAADRLAQVVAPFEVLVLMRERTAVPRALLDQLPALRLIVTTGMRNASVDLAAAAERGVVVCGTGTGTGTGAGTGMAAGGAPAGLPSTAEVAWALILAAVKRVAVEDRALRAGGWQRDFPGSLAGATLGLAGLGNLGAAMLGPARAFGMEVTAWSENLTPERTAQLGVRLVSKQELLAGADVLSIHLVLSDRTRGLFGAEELALMKPGAVLVNTSRGPIVQQEALIEALRTGQLAAAGLDVFDQEPLPPGHPLLALDTAVLTPHLGYVTERGFRSMYGQVVEDIEAFLAGEPIRVLTPAG